MARLVLVAITVALVIAAVQRNADSAGQLLAQARQKIDEAAAQLRGRPQERADRYEQAEKAAQ